MAFSDKINVIVRFGGSSGGGGVVVDNVLNKTSKNPVQNKVITAQLVATDWTSATPLPLDTKAKTIVESINEVRKLALAGL